MTTMEVGKEEGNSKEIREKREGGRRTQNKQICCSSSSLRRDDQASQRGRPACLPPRAASLPGALPLISLGFPEEPLGSWLARALESLSPLQAP